MLNPKLWDKTAPLGRIEDYDKVLPIVEVYRCVQSEGSRFGRPTIAVRTTGCTHRCYFGEGGWCDSWYTSIHPEKGGFTFNDIIKIYDENPHVKEMMLTGGSPTMHPKLVNELTHFAHERGISSLLSRLKVLISSKPIIQLVSFLSHLSLVIVSLLLGLLLPMDQSQMRRWLKRTIVFALTLKPLERVLVIILTIIISLCGMALIKDSLKSKLTDKSSIFLKIKPSSCQQEILEKP